MLAVCGLKDKKHLRVDIESKNYKTPLPRRAAKACPGTTLQAMGKQVIPYAIKVERDNWQGTHRNSSSFPWENP